MKNKPIKRHKALQPLSRDHHGLLLSWKIRAGFSKNIEPNRIKKYADWFFMAHLIPHFEMEEKYVFTILGTSNEFVKRALADHRRLIRLFENDGVDALVLSKIEEELDKHIRFEERILFPEIQKVATDDELSYIAGIFYGLYSAHCTEDIQKISEEFSNLLTKYNNDISLDDDSSNKRPKVIREISSPKGPKKPHHARGSPTRNRLKEEKVKQEAEKTVEVIRQKKKAAKIKAIETPKPKPTLKIGDRVRMHDGRAIGSIDKIQKNKAVVNYGIFTTNINIDLLELVESKK